MALCVFVCISKWLLLGTDNCNLHNGLTGHTASLKQERWRKIKEKEEEKKQFLFQQWNQQSLICLSLLLLSAHKILNIAQRLTFPTCLAFLWKTFISFRRPPVKLQWLLNFKQVLEERDLKFRPFLHNVCRQKWKCSVVIHVSVHVALLRATEIGNFLRMDAKV